MRKSPGIGDPELIFRRFRFFELRSGAALHASFAVGPRLVPLKHSIDEAQVGVGRSLGLLFFSRVGIGKICVFREIVQSDRISEERSLIELDGISLGEADGDLIDPFVAGHPTVSAHPMPLDFTLIAKTTFSLGN